MPVRICQVGFTAPTGVTHSVRVEASSLYEAAGLGLARLKADGWIEGLGPGTQLEIEVRSPSSRHTLSVNQLHRWINSTNASPAETLKKSKIRKMLGA
jgi:hypothetical protein